LVTEIDAEPLLYPGMLADTVVLPSPVPVTVNDPVVPVGIVILEGIVTIPPGLAERLTIDPPCGTGSESVIVAVVEPVIPIVAASSARAMVGTVTCAVTLPGENPVAVARMRAVPTVPAVTVTFALVWPCETISEEGSESTPVSLLARRTSTPPGPAVLPSVIVRVPVELRGRVKGLGLRLMVLTPAVMATVAGALSANLSFTINCTTYVPAISAVKDGVVVVAPDRTAVLPLGRVVRDQENVRVSPSASEDALPSRFAVAPT
jgi:hypothetical protein